MVKRKRRGPVGSKADVVTPPTTDDIRQHFHDNFGSGNDFEGGTLIEIVVAAGRLVSEIVGPEHADAAFAILTKSLGYKPPTDNRWAETLLEDAQPDAYSWPIGGPLHALNAFAYHGIALNGGRDAAERQAGIREDIARIDAFVAKVPFAGWGINPGDVGRTLCRAKARMALDSGEPIDAATFAELAGLSKGRVQNLMAGKNRVFSQGVPGKILAAEALEWLSRKPEIYPPSRWQEQNTYQDLSPPDDLEEAVFVPVAADNTAFHPGLKFKGTYRIGRDGKPHDNFEEALAALQTMSEPAWRRPTAGGHWTLAKAVRWERHDRRSLDRLAQVHSTTELGFST